MFLGLLTRERKEPPREAGYHRLALSSYHFGISPPRDSKEAFTFINVHPIKFPRACEAWGMMVEFAIYDDVDSASPVWTGGFTDGAGFYVSAKKTASFAPGALQFAVWLQEEPSPNQPKSAIYP